MHTRKQNQHQVKLFNTPARYLKIALKNVFLLKGNHERDLPYNFVFQIYTSDSKYRNF